MTDVATDQREFDPHRPFVDWMVYLSGEWLPSAPKFEPPVEVEQLPRGTSIVVQNEPPEIDNSEHQDRIRGVEAAFQESLQIA